MNIAELGLKSLETGEHTSIIFEGQEITNKQMNRASNKLGNALTNLGVQRGDRIILQMPNCPEVLQSFQAIWKIGAVIVPISYQVGQEEVNFIYQDAGATTVITSPEFYEKVSIARSKVPGLDKVIIVGSEAPAGALLFHKLVDDSSDELEIVETADDEVAVLVYTSGTTGTPKDDADPCRAPLRGSFTAGIMQSGAGPGDYRYPTALSCFRHRYDEWGFPSPSRHGRAHAAVQP